MSFLGDLLLGILFRAFRSSDLVIGPLQVETILPKEWEYLFD